MIKIIEANTPQELVNKINNSGLDIFATQPMQENDGSWIAFVYYHSDKTEFDEQGSKSFQPPKKKSNFPVFIPTEEQLERWKKIRPTKNTIELLKKIGYTPEEIKHIKTQYDASIIINSNTAVKKLTGEMR